MHLLSRRPWSCCCCCSALGGGRDKQIPTNPLHLQPQHPDVNKKRQSTPWYILWLRRLKVCSAGTEKEEVLNAHRYVLANAVEKKEVAGCWYVLLFQVPIITSLSSSSSPSSSSVLVRHLYPTTTTAYHIKQDLICVHVCMFVCVVCLLCLYGGTYVCIKTFYIVCTFLKTFKIWV